LQCLFRSFSLSPSFNLLVVSFHLFDVHWRLTGTFTRIDKQ
jgi:hypothetical protein